MIYEIILRGVVPLVTIRVILEVEKLQKAGSLILVNFLVGLKFRIFLRRARAKLIKFIKNN